MFMLPLSINMKDLKSGAKAMTDSNARLAGLLKENGVDCTKLRSTIHQKSLCKQDVTYE